MSKIFVDKSIWFLYSLTGITKKEEDYVMKALLGLVIVAVLVFGAVPAYSGEAVQMWKCEIDDAVNEDQVEAHAANWLAAAKKLPGGENIQAYVYFPVAVNSTGEMDVMFVVVAPSFAEWGKFWDAYGDSDAADIEEDSMEMIVCPDSAVWESFTVEVE